MIAIIALAGLFIFFCVLAFMSAKNWLLRHVFLMLGVFIMTMVFMVMTAMTLQTHKVWKSRHAQLTADLVRTEQRISELTEPADADSEQLSVSQLQAELSRLLLERGRVWRGARVAGADDASIQLDMSAWSNSGCVRASVDGDVQPIAEEGAAPPVAEPHNMTEKMLVHAFAEAAVTQLDPAERGVLFGESEPQGEEEAPRGPCTIPAAYVGHFVVTGVAENGITLQAVRTPDNKQLAMIDAGGSWTLYEVLPIDDHSTLAGMSPESLQTLMEPLAADVAPEKLAASIQDLVRDGTPAEADDPPERVGVLVKFLVDHSIEVDIEAEAGTDDDRTFDVRGRAIPPSLRQGFATEFKAGDTALFDSATANQLVQDGKCELVNEPSRYIRALRNYELNFRTEHDAIADVQADINRTQAENATFLAGAEQVRQQIAYREVEKTKLGEDLKNFAQDGEVVAAYRDDLRSRREAQLDDLGRLYESNNRLRSQLSGF